MKVFPLFAVLALCLCLASPAAADITVPGDFQMAGGDNPTFDMQAGAFGFFSSTSPPRFASMGSNPTIVDYHDTGCIPLDSPDCIGSYSGSFSGGSMSFFASEENGTGSGLPSKSFTGMITSGGFSGEYADINDPENGTLANTQSVRLYLVDLSIFFQCFRSNIQMFCSWEFWRDGRV